MKQAKKISIKTILKILWVIYACLSVVSWLPMANHLITKDYEQISQCITLNDSWELWINGQSYGKVTLEDFRFPPVQKGDQIIMERILPDNWTILEGVLRIHIRQTAVSIFVDGKKVYTYGYDRAAFGKTVGSGLQFIDFPRSYQGKRLTIQMELVENHAFTRQDPIRIYEWKNAYRVLMTENRIPMLFGSFLLIFGLATAMVTIFAVVFSVKYIRLLCVSIFSICIGLWTLCYYNVIMIFSIPLYSVSLMEYISLYLCPIPLTVYMYEDVKRMQSSVFRMLYWILLSVQVFATTVILVLHTKDIVHFAVTLKYMQGLIVISLVYFFIVVLSNLKKSSQTENRLFLAGMLVIGVCITHDLAVYCSDRYFGYTIPTVRGLSCLGVIIFIFILMISFYMNLTRKLMWETERNSLIKSAYTDELTQLHNRRYCMEYINQMKQEHEQKFTVICFDLNNLKQMNDTYGHAKGDILIKSAAEVIAETFEAYGVVARMGGDEFVAVIKISDEEQVRTLMTEFGQNIDHKNRQTEGLNMSIACGSASSSAQETDIDKIYQLADDRMYENKKQMKQGVQKSGAGHHTRE